MNSTRLAGIVPVLLAAATPGCATLAQALQVPFKQPTATFQKLHLRDASLESITLDFEFMVSNPNDVAIKLNTLEYALDVDSKSLAKGTSDKPLELVASGAAPVRLPLTVTYSDLVDNVLMLFSSKETVPYALNVAFGLATPIGTVSIPLEDKGEVPLPKLPDVKVKSVRVGNIGLMGAEVRFELSVANRGQFPIQPRGLDFDIAVAGTSISAGQRDLPTVEADSERTVVIPLRVNFLKLGMAVTKAIRSKSLPYEVKGGLDLGLVKQPFALSGTARL